jgi:hypothetical protein
MFLIQMTSSLARIVVIGHEMVESGRREDLAAAEQVSRSALGVGPVDRGVLVVKMQHEPELDAWVGQRDIDFPGFRQLERTDDIGMLIDVKDAPVLIVGRAMASAGDAQIGGLAGRGLLHQLQGWAVKRIDGDDHPFAMQSVPVPKIAGLGPQSLGEDQERASLADSARAPPRFTSCPAHRFSPAPLVAMSVNSSGARIGTAP